MPKAESWRVWEAYLYVIAYTFGYPLVIYTDQGSHFTGGPFPAKMEAQGVKMFTAPTPSASSVGLAESQVKLVKKGLVAMVQTAPSTMYSWDEQLGGITHALNTRVVRNLGCTPAQLLLGWNPRHRKDEITLENSMRATMLKDGAQPDQEVNEVTNYNRTVRATRLDELRDTATNARMRHQLQLMRSSDPIWRTPRVGELVLYRQKDLDQQRGKKLQPRWAGPYRLIRITRNGQSGVLQELHTDRILKRRHLNHLKIYIPRTDKVSSNPEEMATLNNETHEKWAKVMEKESDGEGTLQEQAKAYENAVQQRALANSTWEGPPEEQWLNEFVEFPDEDREEHDPTY